MGSKHKETTSKKAVCCSEKTFVRTLKFPTKADVTLTSIGIIFYTKQPFSEGITLHGTQTA